MADASLLQIVKDKRNSDRIRSTLRYAALLENHEVAGDGEAEELSELMSYLGRSQEQIVADLGAITHAKSLRQQIRDLPGIVAKMEEMRPALAKLRTEIKEKMEELKKQEMDALNCLWNVEGLFATYNGAQGRLNQLMAQHPGVVTLNGFAKPPTAPADNTQSTAATKAATNNAN